MDALKFSPRFLDFLSDYAHRVGKDPVVIIEEAVSQSILRHESGQGSHNKLLMPEIQQRILLATFPEFPPLGSTDTPFGEFMEHLPDLSWTYQIGRLEDWWFLVVSREPRPFPEPLELRTTESNQAYAWIFGHHKMVRLWSAPNRFLLAF